jgi:tetratricopeptide (TPR) repeat protein
MALQLFEQAIALDPGFALAHAGVAMAYAQLSQLAEMSAEESYPKVAEAAARALSLDEMLPEAHIASSVVKTYERDQRGADYERRRAVELDPHSVFAREHYGMFLSLLGRFSEALEHARMAQSLDPLSPRAAWTVASVLRYARRYDEAIAEARRALQLDPNYGPAYHTLGLCYEAQGRLDEAIDAFLRSGRRPNGNLGHAYAVAGRINEARAIVAELEKHSPERGGMGHIAQVYVGLGDLERAFEWLSRGAERVPSQVPTLKVAEIWDPLRSDPRFLKLLEKEGLSEPQTVK